MSKRVFTTEQDREVASLYQSGQSAIKIANLFGCDKSAVLNALEREGVTRRDNRGLTDSEELMILRIYQSGQSRRKIARVYGKSQPLIKSAIKRQLGKQAVLSDARFALCEEEEQQVIKVYQAGHTMKAIAKTYMCEAGTIKRVLDKWGVPSSQKIRIRKAKKAKADIVILYQDGKSTQEIARQLNISQGHVSRQLSRENVPLRPRRLDNLNQFAFDDLSNPKALYWLGFSYADSNILGNIFRWGLGLKDASHLQQLAYFLKSDRIVEIHKTYCSINFCHPYLVSRLAQLGIVPRRGHFDALAGQIPKGLECHFIRGYLDGDGCISSREKIIFLGQDDILNWIKDCLVKYAGASDKVEPYNRRGIKEIAWGGSFQFRRVVDYIYKDATIYLERKKAIADKTKRG